MSILELVNIIAIVISPIIAIIVGQYLQNKEKRREDKIEIFKALMISRGLGWSLERVKALNIIEIVFSDDSKVINQWKVYFDRLCVENPTETDLSKIKIEGDKLLDVMAKSLGYKEKITWETIQKPYIPKGLVDNMNQQNQFQSAQLDVMSVMKELAQRNNLDANN